MLGVLSGYRVLDFGRYISAPFCAALLAQLGAEVIRIEPPSGSDDRTVMPLGPHEDGALYHQVNGGKRSLALDIAHPDSRDLLERLMAEADVVVANLPPNALLKLKLDYASLCAIRPDIILCSINAYGPNGPYRDAIGFDGTGQALSGALALTGTPAQPYRAAVSYVDFATAQSAALGILAALLRRDRTGKGEHVQASLLGTALIMTNPMLIEVASGARTRSATGNRSPIAGPSDLFRTRDGWIMVQVIGQAMFGRWAALVDRLDLLDDPRFSSDMARGDHGEELSAITAAWTAERTSAACIQALRSHRLPATPLLTPAEALTAPEIVEGGLLALQPRLDGGAPVPVAKAPFSFASATASPPRPAPRLGGDTSAILTELGIDQTRIDSLQRSGVIATARC